MTYLLNLNTVYGLGSFEGNKLVCRAPVELSFEASGLDESLVLFYKVEEVKLIKANLVNIGLSSASNPCGKWQ